ncbi:MAG TPA: acyl-CoA dehydrogenase family protein [Candidatus Acidoferrales bacterium]|nr:acyl-CoA dehydrogenase family protein [Candidatus Acidoferrales bacterium]
MDFALPKEIEELCDNIRKFMDQHVYPMERTTERWTMEVGGPAYPPAIKAVQAKAKAAGYWAFHLPKEAGGAGIPFMHYVFVNEILGRSPLAPVACGSQAPDSGNAEILWRFGTDEQKQRWLKPLVNGDIRSCFSMTEPEVAGSDPRLLRGTAKRDGDYYVINAHKWFSSGGHGASFAIVMAMTNPEQQNPYLRFSQIIVPTDTPGFKIARGIPVMGDYDNHHAEIWYEDCRVPVTNCLGGEGMGFAIAQERLGPGRIHHCMRWLGVAQRAFELMCEYATQREMFGSTLSKKANIQDWIAEARADIQAARLMTLHAAWKIDTQGQQGAREEISLIKFFGAKVLHSVVDKAIQVFGAAGVTEDHPLSMFYRQARFARIYDGPDEVHKMVVARRVLAQYEGKRGA